MRLFVSLLILAGAAPAETVKLAHDPALSPDGKTLVFSWRNDLWSVPSTGGEATRLTSHPGRDTSPAFSPDGTQLAFTSDRSGSPQVHVMAAKGGPARQVTFHTEGFEVREWTPDGSHILTTIVRDFDWGRGSRTARHALVNPAQRSAEAVLFDSYGAEGVLSPDGSRLLFMREGETWARQGYIGSRGGQLWLYDREKRDFTLLKRDGHENRSPLWRPDGKAFYYLSNRGGTQNLWLHEIDKKTDRQLTHFKGDSVVFPAISRDGTTIIFRNRFDLYRWQPGDAEPTLLTLSAPLADTVQEPERLWIDKASDAAFTKNGLEVAFIAGGDVWIMDTELREPRQITQTAEEERDVTFSPDSASLWFVSDQGGQPDVWNAKRKSPAKPWWENTAFELKQVTHDTAAESQIRFTPDGKKLAYISGLGDLVLAEADGSQPKVLWSHWHLGSYDFSPKGDWIVYSQNDEFFNDDIWLVPTDGSQPRFNLSRHPSNDFAPRWSPDGRAIAWTGRRDIDEVDIFYVYLNADDDEETRRERTLKKAREKFKKPAKTTASSSATRKAEDSPKPAPPVPEQQEKPAQPKAQPVPPAKPVVFDLEGIHERIRRVRIPNTTESGLIWSHDSKKLAFLATIDGKRALYSIEPPDETKPKLLSSTALSAKAWLSTEDQIVGMSEGRIGSVSAKTGSLKSYTFRARQTIDTAAKQRAVFDQCWRVMRDRYYDEQLGNKDWDAIRTKYADAAAAAPTMETVSEVVALMLGELNGSHLGFTLQQPSPQANVWKEETAHLGTRFDASHPGPGWKVRDILPKSPASFKESRLKPGDLVLRIDGTEVTPAMDPAQVLNGPLDRDITLTVQSEGEEKARNVTLRPISYSAARSLVYQKWIKDNRQKVEELSKGKLGYLHITAMDDASFQQFQEQLYAAGAGKEGLVIDVRENGGGSTADHLLTALTQPQHAVTIPRGGSKPGYPQDRIIYATWNKPIIVLCNQNSYSNAEIFSHAIKQLKRGQLVGVPTAGGVISTGSVSIMDVGSLRLPFRGWYGIETGLDMELNGAVPHHLIWPLPGDAAEGKDRQLEKAVEVLGQEVSNWLKRPRPALRKASDIFKK